MACRPAESLVLARLDIARKSGAPEMPRPSDAAHPTKFVCTLSPSTAVPILTLRREIRTEMRSYRFVASRQPSVRLLSRDHGLSTPVFGVQQP